MLVQAERLLHYFCRKPTYALAPALMAVARIAARTGAKLFAEVFPTRLERGAGLPPVERIAYLAELAAVQLSGLDLRILIDAKAPVSLFVYPGK